MPMTNSSIPVTDSSNFDYMNGFSYTVVYNNNNNANRDVVSSVASGANDNAYPTLAAHQVLGNETSSCTPPDSPITTYVTDKSTLPASLVSGLEFVSDVPLVPPGFPDLSNAGCCGTPAVPPGFECRGLKTTAPEPLTVPSSGLSPLSLPSWDVDSHTPVVPPGFEGHKLVPPPGFATPVTVDQDCQPSAPVLPGFPQLLGNGSYQNDTIPPGFSTPQLPSGCGNVTVYNCDAFVRGTNILEDRTTTKTGAEAVSNHPGIVHINNCASASSSNFHARTVIQRSKIVQFTNNDDNCKHDDLSVKLSTCSDSHADETVNSEICTSNVAEGSTANIVRNGPSVTGVTKLDSNANLVGHSEEGCIKNSMIEKTACGGGASGHVSLCDNLSERGDYISASSDPAFNFPVNDNTCDDENLYEDYELEMIEEEIVEVIDGMTAILEATIGSNKSMYEEGGEEDIDTNKPKTKKKMRKSKNDDSNDEKIKYASSQYPDGTACHFHSSDVPAATLHMYVKRLVCLSMRSKSVYITALMYLERVQQSDDALILNERNVRRLLLCALYVADRYIEDVPWTADYMAEIGALPGGVDEVGLLEWEFLRRLGWNCGVNIRTYRMYEEAMTVMARSGNVEEIGVAEKSEEENEPGRSTECNFVSGGVRMTVTGESLRKVTVTETGESCEELLSADASASKDEERMQDMDGRVQRKMGRRGKRKRRSDAQ